MKLDDRLSLHVHSFFNVYLTAQRNVSPHTFFSYRDTIKLFLTFASRRLSTPVVQLKIDELTADVVLAFLDHLEHERANTIATRNVRLAALHVFFRHVAAQDPLLLDQCHRVIAVPFKRGVTKTVGYLEREDLQAIFGRIDRTTPEGRRDYALLTFTYQTGARVQEVVAVRASDFELDPPSRVRLWGKGRKERILPLWPQTAALLRDLLRERGIDPRSAQPVFVNMRGQSLTRWGVRHLLQKYARKSIGTRVHPHLLRHTAAVHMLQAGVDPNVIRDVLGHASSETTWRYARINIDMKRKAIESYAPKENQPSPTWHRDKDLLIYLEGLGKRCGYVASIEP